MDPIEFHLNASRLLSAIIFIIYLGAMISLCMLPIQLVIKVLLIMPIIYLLIRNLETHAWKKSNASILRLWQDCEGRWGCETRGGRQIATEILPDSFISSFLIILRLRSKVKTVTVVVPIDSLTQAEYRTLIRRILFF